MNKNTLKVLTSSVKQDWETPQDLFEKLNQEFHFTLDVCASTTNFKCSSYYTEQEDGLKQNWGKEACWMNPPYGREIGKWMKKAYESWQAGATVVCLVPSRTGAKWFQDYALKGCLRFLPGRIRFVGAKHSAPFDSILVIFHHLKAGDGRTYYCTDTPSSLCASLELV